METDHCTSRDPAPPPVLPEQLRESPDEASRIPILVIFCYNFRFSRLKRKLNEIFPERLIFVEERVSSEDFEVFVAGKLVHSKKRGDGYVDGYLNESKMVKVVAQIQEVLKDL